MPRGKKKETPASPVEGKKKKGGRPKRVIETPAPPVVAAPAKKPRKPRAPKPKPPVFPVLAGRKSKAKVTEKTFLRMSQRHAKMTGLRGVLRRAAVGMALAARRRGRKTRAINRAVTRRVFGTRFGRRALLGAGLAGAAAGAAMIIRRRRKRK